MKKIYVTPQMEIFSYKMEGVILTASLEAIDYGGGGGAGARIFEDDGMDLLTGGDFGF
ncbi:MAG: hypothetical protein IJ069_12620 [Prevotella sp.]|nr:hypothetical protein [Prevotella sp.]MBQ8154493.1 hypothetical protein [Prevotella sp.]